MVEVVRHILRRDKIGEGFVFEVHDDAPSTAADVFLKGERRVVDGFIHAQARPRHGQGDFGVLDEVPGIFDGKRHLAVFVHRLADDRIEHHGIEPEGIVGAALGFLPGVIDGVILGGFHAVGLFVVSVTELVGLMDAGVVARIEIEVAFADGLGRGAGEEITQAFGVPALGDGDDFEVRRLAASA